MLTASASHDLVLLLRYPVAVGVDGYYYVLQVNELRHHGHLYFSTSTPIALYFLTGVSYLTGNTILAVKIGAITLHFLLAVGVFALLVSTTGSKWIGALGTLLTVISGLRMYMLSEFIGSLAAITLFVWCGYFVVRFVQTRRAGWAVGAVILLSGAGFSHRSLLAIAFGIAILAGLLHWLLVQEPVKHYRRYLAILILLVVWLSPAILAAQSLLQLPQWLKGELLIIPRLPFDQYALGEEIVGLLASVSIMFLLIYFKERLQAGSSPYLFGAIALWSLVVTLNPFLDAERGWLSVAGRLRGFAYLQAAILVPGLVWCFLGLRRELVFYVTPLVLPLMILSMSVPLPRGMQPDYLSDRAELIRNLPQQRQRLGPNPIIIAAHGDEFLVTAVLGVPSQHSVLGSAEYQNVYWLLHRLKNENVTVSVSVVRMDSPSMSTVLIEDGELRERLSRMDDSERHGLFAVNPHLARAYNSGAIDSN